MRSVFWQLLIGLGGFAFLAGPVQADEYEPVEYARGELLYSEDFSEFELGGPWSIIEEYSSYFTRAGSLIGAQIEGSRHGAVVRRKLAFKDVLIQVDFRFEGSPSWNFVVNDKHYDQVHAGHICRLQVRPDRIKVGDDKLGVMNLKHFAIRNDPDHQDWLQPIFERTSSIGEAQFKRGKWYRLEVLILGDRMEAHVDGALVVGLQSDGFDHPTKTDFGFTVNQSEVWFDNLKVWKVSSP